MEHYHGMGEPIPPGLGPVVSLLAQAPVTNLFSLDYLLQLSTTLEM